MLTNMKIYNTFVGLLQLVRGVQTKAAKNNQTHIKKSTFSNITLIFYDRSEGSLRKKGREGGG